MSNEMECGLCKTEVHPLDAHMGRLNGQLMVFHIDCWNKHLVDSTKEKAETCHYCGSADIAYREGEIVACSKCYAKMQSTFFEPSVESVQTSVDLEMEQATQFPATLHTADFGTFSLSRIDPNGEAVYLGNELVTQGYEIRLADMGDYFAGLRNFPVSDNDDLLSNFDENGKEII